MHFRKEKMNQRYLVLYGHTTPSDLDLLESSPPSFPSTSTASTLSSTGSDAQSAPPELERVFDKICNEYAECMVKAGKQLPPQWDMPDLVRAVIGEEAVTTPGFLKNLYYDIMLHGANSWLCQDILNFIDLINYTTF